MTNPLFNKASADNIPNPFDLVHNELQQVEELLRQQCEGAGVMQQALLYTLKAGGKRLRPAMVLFSAGIIGGAGLRPVSQGAVAELIHTSSLLHDDVLDQSDMRRGQPTVGIQWGNSISILAGDYLVSRALHLLAEDGDMSILQVYSKMLDDMCQGEALESTWKNNPETPRDIYLEIIGRKTACFFEACCRVGALVSEARPSQVEELGTYGYNFGLAFQIADDVRDLMGDLQDLGKPAGNDLRDGKATLPFLCALECADEKDHARLSDLLKMNEIKDEEIQEAIALAKKYEAPQKALDIAHEYVNYSLQAIKDFPESEYWKALQNLADFVIFRQ